MAQVSKALGVWMDELNTKSKHTREVYLLYFNKFLERWGIADAEALYEMRRADLSNGDTRDQQNIERMVKTYMAEMQKKGYAAGSCRQVSKAVSSFLESQGLDLNLREKDKPKGAYNGQRLALADHIKTMWDYAPTETKLKTRGQLMFLKDSGIRISDLANLNLGEYLEAETIMANGEAFKKFWPKETEKMAEVAHIHVGPEAVRSLEEYLSERRDQGLDMKPESPLFLNRFGDRFDASSVGMVFMRIGRRIGKKLSAHSLRKFHKTMLEGAGMPEQWIMKLQGKAADVYSKPEETGKLTEKYVECYDALRVFGGEASAQQVQEQASELMKLKAENEELRKRVDALSKASVRQDRHDATLAELLKRIERLEKGRDEGEQPVA